MDRRRAIKSIAGITTGVVGMTTGIAHATSKRDATLKPGERLAYAKLDPAKVASIAFRKDVRHFGCMYQVFHSVIEALSHSDSPDAERFAQIPTTLSRFGRGGVLGQGAICGSNNGSGMLYDLLSINGQPPKSLGLVSNYYQETLLPRNDKAFLNAVGMTDIEWKSHVGSKTEAKSLLCHASLTRWSNESGKPITEKEVRCQLLSVAIAWRVVELLNIELASLKLPQVSHIEETEGCLGCHTKGLNESGAPSVMAKMECSSCHGHDPHSS